MEKYSGIHDEKLTRVVSTFCIIAHCVQVVISDWQYSVSWIFECKNWNIQTFKWFSVQIFRYSDQTFKYLDIVLSQSSCWFQIWTNLLHNLILTMHFEQQEHQWFQRIIFQLADICMWHFLWMYADGYNVCFVIFLGIISRPTFVWLVLTFIPMLFIHSIYLNNNMLHSNLLTSMKLKFEIFKEFLISISVGSGTG